MNRTTPPMRKLARRLIAWEAGQKVTGQKNESAFPVPDRLRPHLVTLLGNGGFHALVSRALTLAQEEVPWLGAVDVKVDGSLGGVEDSQIDPTPDALREGRVALLAQLLGLLVAFIGDDLTVRLMREVWPKISLNELSLPSPRGQNEKDN